MNKIKLGDAGYVFNGNSINAKVKKEKYCSGESGLPYIATKDLTFRGEFDYENGVKIPFSELDNFKVAKHESVLICAEGGSAGRKIGFLNTDVCFGNKLFAYEPKREFCGRYVYYYFLSSEFQKDFKSNLKGIIGGVSLKKFKELEIPQIPLTKQLAIVSKLDQALEAIDQAIANTQKNIENVEDLEKSYLNSVFDSMEMVTNSKLGEIIEFVNGFAFKSSEKVESSGTQLVRMTNLYMNEFNLNRNPVFYPNHFTETYKKFVLTNGDLIMSLTGTTGKEDFGYTVQVENQSNNLLLNQRITKILVKDSNQLNKSYLLHFLRSRVFLDKLYSMATGTRQANISTNKISQIHIPLPTILRQGEISAEVDSLSSKSLILKNDLSKKLSLLNELKMNILEKAFKGELV